MLERDTAGLSALCLQPVLLPDLDGQLSGTVLARLAAGQGSVADAAEADWTLEARLAEALDAVGLPGLAPERAIAGLPDGARTVFVLHEVEGYRVREVADLLAVAEGTVKAQLHRGRALLKDRLAKVFGPTDETEAA